MGAFDPVKFDTAPIGSVIQSPINLETATNGKYIALDGRDCNRSDYPELATYFPAGVFTSTARTLAGAPANAVIAADGTNFLASAAAGVSALQFSATGTSWANSGGWTAATAFNSLIYAGARFIAAPSAGETQPHVTSNTVDPSLKSNWTATTGGTTTTLTQGLAYSPSLGKTVLCKEGSLATSSALFYLNDGATAWSACSGGSTATRYGVCWSGQKFIALTSSTGFLQTSSDGATFADLYISNVTTAQIPTSSSIASDGNGTVVIAIGDGYQSYVTVSKDHGTTWREMLLPVEPALFGVGFKPVGSVSYVNGKFIMPLTIGSSTWAYQVAVSADGLNWFIEPMGTRGIPAVTFGAIAYKSGTYCAIKTTAAALTSVENSSKFRLPKYINASLSPTANMTFADSTPRYIKARS